MLPEVPDDIKEAQELGISIFAGEAEEHMDDVIREAERRGVEIVSLPTVEALARLREDQVDTNAVLHVTC